MYKIVLVALFVAVVAEPEPEPGALIASFPPPLTYSSWYSPATTTITKSASSVVSPSPYIYSSPYYPHFIKKRSPGAVFSSSYISPYAYNAYNGAYVSPALATPLVHSAAPVLSSPALTYAGAPAHFIKKRSAPLAAATYISPAATAFAAPAGPLYASTYAAAAAPFYSSGPLYTSPFGYSHFIKKRSAVLPYLAPSSYSFSASAPLVTSTYAAATPYLAASPYIAASPYYGYNTYIKK